MATLSRLFGRGLDLLGHQSLRTQRDPYIRTLWMLVSCLSLICRYDANFLLGWATVLGFVAYTIALLVKAPKASAEFVFVDTNNDTG